MPSRLLSAVLSCLALLGCTPATSYELFNNTGSNVQVTWGFRKFLVAPQSVVHIYGSGDSSDLVIESNQAVWKYAAPPYFVHWETGSWQDTYVSRGFPAGYILRVQLEPDGRIYVVPTSASFPTKVSNQPGPFPLVPVSTRSPNMAVVTDAPPVVALDLALVTARRTPLR